MHYSSKTPIEVLALLTNVSNSPSRVETSKRQTWKIAPKSWTWCLTDLLSLSAPNAVPIGVEDGKIPNGYVTSSSTYNRYHAPWLGRINNKARGRNKGGWSAKKNDKRQWLQFNLGRPTLITVIRTQGRQDASQWVTSYKVYFGNDGVRFTPYKKGGRVKVCVSV